MAKSNYTKSEDEIKSLKAALDYLEKKCWKLDILNDNLYGWVFALWTAFLVSFICNLIQLAN